jgi:redox-sensitive bicupin YhaK (pirin superfamily)
VDLFGTVLDEGETVTHETCSERKLWVQLVWGTVEVNGHRARAGDGFAIENESRLAVAATSEAELLLFDMTA